MCAGVGVVVWLCVCICINSYCLLGDFDCGRVLYLEDVPLVEFMYLVFTRMPGES